jgi:prepilin-type N-terminal cleavage/methylation domain-containing protein
VRRARGERGFTLLELLITLSVTTIGLVGLLALHLSIARGNDGASRSADAQQITVAQLETLRGQNTATMMATIDANPTVNLLGRNALQYTCTRTYTILNGASASLVRLRVVTAWTEDGGTVAGNAGHTLALEIIRTIEEKL